MFASASPETQRRRASLDSDKEHHQRRRGGELDRSQRDRELHRRCNGQKSSLKMQRPRDLTLYHKHTIYIAYTSNEDTSAKSFTRNAGREFHRRRRRGELYRRRSGIELHQRHRGRELYQRRSGRKLHRRRNEVDKTEISVHRWSMSFISVLLELLVALSVFFFLHNNRSPEQKCQTKK
ncbi:hypothetical protein Bca4012_072885 [Brassica carinata]